jgi:hypothetical protein
MLLSCLSLDWFFEFGLVSWICFALAGYIHTGTGVQCFAGTVKYHVYVHVAMRLAGIGTQWLMQLQVYDKVFLSGGDQVAVLDTDTSIEQRKNKQFVHVV